MTCKQSNLPDRRRCRGDAHDLIKENADYICEAKGGKGALREIYRKKF